MHRNQLSRKTALLMSVVVMTLLLIQQHVPAEIVVLSPQSVVELAQKQSIMIKNSSYTVKSSKYSKKQAFTAFLPMVNGNVQYSRLDESPSMPSFTGDMTGIDWTDSVYIKLFNFFGNLKIGDPPLNMWNMSVSVNQPLFLGFRALNGYRMSEKALESEQLSHQRLLDEARLTALQLFWGYVSALEGAGVTAETRSWFENLIANQQALYESGLIIEHVVLKTKAGLTQAKLAQIQAGHAADYLREALLLFLNMPLNMTVQVDTNAAGAVVPAAAGELPQSLLDTLVLKREDIRAMSLKLDMLKLLRTVQLGAYLPSLFGAFNYRFANDNYEHIDKLDPGWTASVIMNVPIFDWGKNYRDVQKTDCQIAQLELGLKASQERVRADILQAHRKYAESIEQFSLAQEGVSNAKRALEIAELQYQEGAITHVELHEARKELTSAQANMIMAKTGRELAAAQYAVATGR